MTATIVVSIIIKILIIFNNGNSGSYNDCDNLTIIIITIRIIIEIIHNSMLYLLRIEFYNFSMYSISDLISQINGLEEGCDSMLYFIFLSFF